jgi:hypothetical protein
MNKRMIIFFSVIFIMIVTAFTVAFVSVSVINQNKNAVQSADNATGETAFEKKLRQRGNGELDIDFTERQAAPKKKDDSKAFKETDYKFKVLPSVYASPDAFNRAVAEMEERLAEERQKCDDRLALTELRYEQQDLNRAEYIQSAAKVNFRKEQYTAAVMRKIIEIISKTTFMNDEGKAAQSAAYKERLDNSEKLCRQYKAEYDAAK